MTHKKSHVSHIPHLYTHPTMSGQTISQHIYHPVSFPEFIAQRYVAIFFLAITVVLMLFAMLLLPTEDNQHANQIHGRMIIPYTYNSQKQSACHSHTELIGRVPIPFRKCSNL